MLNLVFIFMLFVSKMTKLNIKNNQKLEYPVVAWSNLILITILLFCSWGYYVKNMRLTEWFRQIVQNHDAIVTVVGFSVIIVLFIVSVIILIYNTRKKHLDEKEIL